MKNKQLKVLVTGAAGFVGSYLLDELKSQGFKTYGTDILETEQFIKLNVTDFENIKYVLQKLKPDKIIHLAGYSSVKKSFEMPELCMQINYGGTRNLLEACRNLIPGVQILIIGSAEVYGNPKYLPIDENHPLNGQNPYALSRIKQESLLEEFKDLTTFWTRSFNHSGPGQDLGFVIPDFSSQVAKIILKQQEPIINVGNLEAARDFADVRDVVKGYLKILQKGKPLSIYNVSSGKAIKIEEFLNKLIEISGTKIKIKIDHKKIRKIDVPIYYGSHKKLTDDTGWVPQITFNKLLEDTLQYWLNKYKT